MQPRLNKTNGQIGYVTLGHLDPRRLSLATQPPPLPSQPGVTAPKKSPPSPAIPLPAGMTSSTQRNYMPTNPSTASTGPSFTPTSGMSASQQRMSMLLQMSAASSTPPPSVARPQPPEFPPPPPSMTPPTPRQPPSSSHVASFSQRSRSIESSTHAGPATGPQLRISDRLATRQADAARYDHMESELESLLSMPVTGAASSPVRGKRDSSLGSRSSRSSSFPGSGVRIREVSSSPTQTRGGRNPRRESLTAPGAGQEVTAVQGEAVAVSPVTPYSLFAMPPPAPAEDSADNF
ncbi:hypothetical protein BC830DRAFT_170537 [Chytriomyces sp. MP71]|nr:hypothetical protein BC830DRAFT_170537 [Chytriomyces sp. MP71]